jgi:outer membrane protease
VPRFAPAAFAAAFAAATAAACLAAAAEPTAAEPAAATAAAAAAALATASEPAAEPAAALGTRASGVQWDDSGTAALPSHLAASLCARIASASRILAPGRSTLRSEKWMPFCHGNFFSDLAEQRSRVESRL